MIKISQVTDIEELLKLWPRLVTLIRDDNGGLSTESVLQLLLSCFGNGAVFVVRNDHGLVGSCCLTKGNTCIVVHSLPNDNGEKLGKHCLEAVEKWARFRGIERLQVSTDRLCGSSYRYFEKTLGFRRKTITFTKEL